MIDAATLQKHANQIQEVRADSARMARRYPTYGADVKSLENSKDVAIELQEHPWIGKQAAWWELRTFIKKANELDAREPTTSLRGLELLHSEINALLDRRAYGKVNFLLKMTRCEDCTLNVLIGILCTTLADKEYLSCRADFFKRAKNVIETNGWSEPRLLDGLE